MSQLYNVIDSDQHVNPPAQMWAEYLPEKFRARAPVIEDGEDGQYFVFEGRRKKVITLSAMAGTDAKDYKADAKSGEIEKRARDAGADATVRLSEMKRDGIDAAIMFGGGPLGSSDPELFLASFEAYNRWLNDFCSTDPQKLFGVGYVPMLAHDIQGSIKLMREYARLGFRGINIPAFPMTEKSLAGLAAGGSAGPMLAITGDAQADIGYDSPEFDPFWACAAELDMPITIHLGARGVRMDPRHFLPDLLMTKLAMAEPVAIMIFGGVFERHPGLKFVTVEAGVGWFSFAADYMDRTWEKQRFWTKNTLQNPPSFYFDRNIYGTFIHDRSGIENRNQLGGRNIMWSSDYPHSETTFPESQAWIDRLFAGVPEADKADIICNRAKTVFRL
ncbi:MAG: amidohydrolase [Novosphingobium sp.]|nr:amidohydrolase [Novosphingobium sp.]